MGGSDLRRDDFRDQIATFIADLGVVDRAERVRLYRFARGLLRIGMADLSEPRDRRGRTQTLLDLEAAIRDTERGFSSPADTASPAMLPEPATPVQAATAPWPGPGRVLATLITRNIRMMLAKDPFAYLWLFLAPVLTIAAVLGSKHTFGQGLHEYAKKWSYISRHKVVGG